MAVRYFEGLKLRQAGDGINPEKLQEKIIEVLLRKENNLIKTNEDRELFTDLQIIDGATPTTDFEVGVTVGRVEARDGWEDTGTLLVAKTTSGDNIKWLFTDQNQLWIDNGTGVFQYLMFGEEIQEIFDYLQAYIEDVENMITVFSGDEGINYYIKVSNSEPELDTPNNVITFVLKPQEDIDISQINITPQYGHSFTSIGQEGEYIFDFLPLDHTEMPQRDAWLEEIRANMGEYFDIEKITNGFKLTCKSMPSSDVSLGVILRSNEAFGAFYAHLHP